LFSYAEKPILAFLKAGELGLPCHSVMAPSVSPLVYRKTEARQAYCDRTITSCVRSPSTRSRSREITSARLVSRFWTEGNGAERPIPDRATIRHFPLSARSFRHRGLESHEGRPIRVGRSGPQKE
jgi:hypothetical protein